MQKRGRAWAIAGWLSLALLACGGDGASGSDDPGTGDPADPADPTNPANPANPANPTGPTNPTDPAAGPQAGNPDGKCAVPAEAQAEDSSAPTTVVGTGTPASCTGDAFVAAVKKGGVITFNCGAAPATITLTQTALVYNDAGPKVVIDGGGKITLSGGGKVRILKQNTCDAALNGGADCNDAVTPALTVQNLTFIDGNAKGLDVEDNLGGGGAIWVRGGRFKIVNSRFFGNVCDELGSDVGGGAVRVLDFPSRGTSQTRPVFVVNSTFGGAGMGNSCANGGALSSIGTSYTLINSLFSDNKAVGEGANDGQGGNGGAIYNDGNTFTLSVCGTLIEKNHANEGGSAIFYVSNNRTGSLVIKDSVLRQNPKGAFETAGYPGMFIIAKPGDPQVSGSTIQ